METRAASGPAAHTEDRRGCTDSGPPPFISVIVLNWNGSACIDECLRSLEAQTYRDFEVVVVDNCSTDGSRELLQREWAGRVCLHLLDANYGYCGGNNRGIAQARGSLIVLLNNDTETDPGWLAALAGGAKRNPGAGMFACRILNAFERDRFDSTGLLVYPDGVCRSRGWQEMDIGQYNREEEVLGPNGAAAAYRRDMLDETGLFDEPYFAYLEDLDLALRGWLLGFSCVYIPDAVVYHIKSLSSGHHSKLKAFYVERNRLWNLIKLFPLRLILVSPAFTSYRYILQSFAALTHQGASGGFVHSYSRSALISVLMRAVGSGILGLPYMLRRRREVQRTRRLGHQDYMRVISRFKLSALELALKD
jgi:GT2 family glycosyltransferase